MSPGCPNFLNPLVMFGYTQAGIQELTPMSVQIDNYVREYSYSGTLFQPLRPVAPNLTLEHPILRVPADEPIRFKAEPKIECDCKVGEIALQEPKLVLRSPMESWEISMQNIINSTPTLEEQDAEKRMLREIMRDINR